MNRFNLFLQELMSHGQEGDREPTAEEENEVDSQLVSATKHNYIDNGKHPILVDHWKGSQTVF